MSEHPRTIDTEALDWSEQVMGPFACKRKGLGQAAGGRELGCSLYRLEPGQKAYPAHFHHHNEEAILVTAGEGTLRLGDEHLPVRRGHYVAFPAGEGLGHQLVNTSDGPLEYLCLSTNRLPEVAEYPDSGKVGVMGAPPPDGDTARRLLKVFLLDSDVAYWEGES